MKRASLYASLLIPCLAAWSVSTAVAADSAEGTPAAQKAGKDEGKGKKGKKAKAQSPMGAALGKLKCFTAAKPKLDAKYYIFLFSTSSCTHCMRAMPRNVELYKEMRRRGDVEMMLVTLTNLDNAQAAQGFLTKFKAPFAAATDTEVRAAGVPVIQKVNQNGPGMILALPPHIVIVDKDGKLVHEGPGSVNGQNVLEDWQQYTGGKPAAKKPAAKSGKGKK